MKTLANLSTEKKELSYRTKVRHKETGKEGVVVSTSRDSSQTGTVWVEFDGEYQQQEVDQEQLEVLGFVHPQLDVCCYAKCMFAQGRTCYRYLGVVSGHKNNGRSRPKSIYPNCKTEDF